MQTSVRICAALLGLAMLAPGCGDSGLPPLAPVSGHVTLDGKPLAKAQVYFNSEGGIGRTASAMSDENGYYELRYTSSSAGSQLGPHHVTISNLRFNPNNPNDSGREVLPKRYQATGAIKVDITDGPNVHDFELKSK